jgi:hypothetical protein
MKITAIIIISLNSIACAPVSYVKQTEYTQPVNTIHKNYGGAEYLKDAEKCEYEGKLATAGIDSPAYINSFLLNSDIRRQNDASRQRQENELYDMCMSIKGWIM